ncbi:helix-turn-helix domain-containing protein [Leisingera aquaemixtae]|uniref:GlxA family transcriptional regulator n=1 Tax=Leisingera aquaemixtae TaxID=1396826 RepID=UPI001C941682|nr:helix-turn-helix domain-containing protein [Leisingera aquaemixtae]MBY6067343.1 helix-turn-helix domain-containing protein [Leisingera aquaemixtae]
MPKVSFILFPEFQMLAYVLASETLRIANKNAGRPLYTWETLSVTQAPVPASSGRLAAPDRSGWELGEPPGLVLLCAGYDPLRHLPQGLRAYLARAGRAGATLGGIDTGTVVLAQLGYLDGHEAVLHHEAEAGFRERWPDIAVSDRIYCFGRGRLTAVGGTATGDAMLAWVAATGPDGLAAATSEDMAHGSIRPPEVRQRLQPSADPVLGRMQQLMLDNLPEPLALTDIAGRLGLSLKALRLRCKRGLGMTPQAAYLQMRLQRARELLQSTAMPVTEVALATGFASLPGFSRQFKAMYQRSPRDMRRR